MDCNSNPSVGRELPSPDEWSLCGIVGLTKNGDAIQDSERLLKQLQPLRTKLSSNSVNPVTFPPGRARLATRPAPTGSTLTNTIGIVAVAAFAASAAGAAERHDHIDAEANQLARQCGSRSYCLRAQRIVDREHCGPRHSRAACSPCRNARQMRRSNAIGVTASRKPITGIAGCCARAASGQRRRAAEQRDELAPSHSITSSARASTSAALRGRAPWRS